MSVFRPNETEITLNKYLCEPKCTFWTKHVRLVSPHVFWKRGRVPKRRFNFPCKIYSLVDDKSHYTDIKILHDIRVCGIDSRYIVT